MLVNSSAGILGVAAGKSSDHAGQAAVILYVVHGEDSYNAFAYANPVRHVLANILGTQKEVALVDLGPPGLPDEAPVPDRVGEAAGPADVNEEPHRAHVVFKASVAEPIETYLYRPVIAGYLALARRHQTPPVGAARSVRGVHARSLDSRPDRGRSHGLT